MSGPTQDEIVSGIRRGRVASAIEERTGISRALCEMIADHLDESDMLRKLDSAKPRLDDAELLLHAGIIAIQHTRDYVGHRSLPALPGWSWYDWSVRVYQFFGIPRDPGEDMDSQPFEPTFDLPQAPG